MAYCATCGTELPTNGRFCSSCGRPASNTDDVATIDFANDATLASPLPPRPPSSRSTSRPPSSLDYQFTEGRFLPGRLVAGRYRIIALLGKGGMGEVYRADDLTLGQPVALKFLPDEAARDESLARSASATKCASRAEFRIPMFAASTTWAMSMARPSSPWNTSTARTWRRCCAASAASRKTRPSKLRRQLCAGLAAAHAKGVLHRDLKPANIMLDGRGQVVITDFGLAGVADNIRGNEIRSGTPAYMAPEQLSGKKSRLAATSTRWGLCCTKSSRASARSPTNP